ncbi:MAG: tetratricopeptide repeat protein [Gemmatimonadaceae bacterium]|nr:tetratricopeptide repeat protein [Gemmatimonadaceae bacterium]
MSPATDTDRSHALLRALADRIDATDPGACNNLGVLYYSKGLHAEAVQAFLRALALGDPARGLRCACRDARSTTA